MSRRDPSLPAALREGSRLTARGRIEEAAALYDAILRRDPANKKARKALLALQRTRGSQPSKVDFEHVQELLARGRIDSAQAEASRLCRTHPTQPALQNLLGVVLARRGHRDEAVARFRQALLLEPQFDDALSNMASVLHQQGRHRDAVHCYQELVNRGHRDAGLYSSLALALRAAGLLEDALEACRRALRLRPLDPDVLNTLGNVLNDLHRHNEAIDAYSRALAIDAAHREARVNLTRSRARARARAGERAPVTQPQLADARAADAGVADPQLARALFAELAESYDQQCREAGYSLPSRLPALLQRLDGEDAWYEAAVDLGCGTGLAGTQLRSFCSQLTGVDVALPMLQRADATAVYDELMADDIAHWLQTSARRFDLVICADVLPCIGALETLFALVAGSMNPGARFLFTTERQADDGVSPGPSGRYTHDDAYVTRCADAAGLLIAHSETFDLRREHGTWLQGSLFVAGRER